MKTFKQIISLVALSFLINTSFAQNDSGQLFNSFDKTKIYYEVRGNGSPVILVHGFSNTGENWKSTALYTDLLNQGFKVIILDNGGTAAPINRIHRKLMSRTRKHKTYPGLQIIWDYIRIMLSGTQEERSLHRECWCLTKNLIVQYLAEWDLILQILNGQDESCFIAH